MTRMRDVLFAAASVGGLALAAALPVAAQEYPSRPIEFTVPLTPTSILDSVYGAFALKLNMPFLVWVWPNWVMVLNCPTA